MEKTGDKEKKGRTNLSLNPNTLRCVLEILDAKCQVFCAKESLHKSLCKVLGFSRNIYKAGRNEHEDFVNILSVNSILVHCVIIEASCLNRIEAPVIYNFFPEEKDKTRLSALYCILSTSH